MRLLIPLLLMICCSVRAAIVIGDEALISTPATAQWSGLINLRPGTNETVTLNPPIFSWFYAPGSPTNASYDMAVYKFQFQASYSANFSTLIFDVNTWSPCYNFIAPFTNSPVYWRVGYLDTNSPPSTNSWITNVFYISSDSNNWDRSYLADTNHWVKSHPYLWLNAANRAAIGAFLPTNNPANWQAITNLAQTGLDSGWWSTNWGTNVLADEHDRAYEISSVAFMWQITQDPKWTNGLVKAYTNLVNYWFYSRRWATDWSDDSNIEPPRAIMFGYDFLYDLLPASGKASAVAALRKLIRVTLYDAVWMTPTNTAISIYPSANSDPTGEYPGPYRVPNGMAPKMMASHPNGYSEFLSPMCLPILADDSDARLLFELWSNFQIAYQGSPYGTDSINRGRHYGYRLTFSRSTAETTLFLNSIWTQMNFTNNPVLRTLSDWWLRMTPPGFQGVSDSWGDYNTFESADWWRRIAFGRDTAMMSANGNITLARDQTESLYGGRATSFDPYWDFYVREYLNPIPSPTTNTTLAAVFREGGWVLGSQYAPNTIQAFSNGTMFAFAARPMGSDMNHTRLNDLELEIYAYGAQVTASQGGSGYAGRTTWMFNSLLINGTGQVETAWGPREPIYGKIIAFTNGDDFVYFAGDATKCYPHEAFPMTPEGGNENPTGTYLPERGPDFNYAMPYVSKVVRHVLSPHRKYFVVYDELQTTQPATFQWLWHTRETNNQSGVGSFSYVTHPYNQTATFPWSNVVVEVFQVVNASLLSVTNRAGSDVYKNPITGTDLSAYAATDDGSPQMTNVVWVSNITPTTNWHFMTVIYPIKPGDGDPTITRLTDNSVRVQQGSDDDVVSFGETNASPASTLIVSTLSPSQPLPFNVPSVINAGTIRAQRISW